MRALCQFAVGDGDDSTMFPFKFVLYHQQQAHTHATQKKNTIRKIIFQNHSFDG